MLTFNSAQTGTVQIVGARRPRRVSQFSENRGVAARDLNQVLTDIIAQNRETWDKINDVTGRAVVAPVGETLSVLPQKSSRAGLAFCFDTNGNPTVCGSIPSTTFSAGTGITFTGTGPTTISLNQAGITGPLNLTAAVTETLNNLVTQTLQDASSSQDTLTMGVVSSTNCDPGYTGTPGNGPCAQQTFTPNGINAWSAYSLKAVNSRMILTATGGTVTPEIVLADTANGFGIPVWNGGNQAGIGLSQKSRINSGSPATLDIVNSGVSQQASIIGSISGTTLTVTTETNAPIVVGMTIVGTGITANTKVTAFGSGSGGTGTYTVNNSQTIGSENMVGGASGAEGSMAVSIWSGSLDGLTQGILGFFSAAGCSSWANNCSGTGAGMRLGEIAANGQAPDGLFTQTETASINFYADSNWSGTHLDNSYTAPSNIVMRIAFGTNSPESVVGGWYAPGTLALGAWAANGNGFTAGPGSITFKDGASITGNMSGGTILASASGQLQVSSSVTGTGAFLVLQTGAVTSGRVACWTANGILRQGLSGTSC